MSIRSGTGVVGLEGDTEEVGVKDKRTDRAGCETVFSLRGASRLAWRGVGMMLSSGTDAQYSHLQFGGKEKKNSSSAPDLHKPPKLIIFFDSSRGSNWTGCLSHCS